MGELWRRWQYLLHRGRNEQDLEDEMRWHREMATKSGRSFGNVTQLGEASRAVWVWPFLETLGAGRALRAAHVARQSWLCGHRGTVPGTGHRRKHRHFQHPQRRDAALAAGGRSAAAGAAWLSPRRATVRCAPVSPTRSGSRCAITSRLSREPGVQHGSLRLGRGRREPLRGGPMGQRRFLPRAGRARHARPRLHAG